MYPNSLEFRTIVRRTLEFKEARKEVKMHAFQKHLVSAILPILDFWVIYV